VFGSRRDGTRRSTRTEKAGRSKTKALQRLIRTLEEEVGRVVRSNPALLA